MSELSVFEMYQFMSNENVFFAYTGTFDHFSINSLLKNVKNKFDELDIERGIGKKIHAILVEQVENIRKHSSHDANRENTGILLLSKTPKSYVVVTGNQVLNTDVPRLRNRVEHVCKLTVPELKEEYKKQLLAERTDDNGAGLGLIDIAIKSDGAIRCIFKKHTEDSTFYILQTEIDIKTNKNN